MIANTIRNGKRNYLCDDCRHAIEQFKSYVEARDAGWAVSRDRKVCYCPDCAPTRRNVGKSGRKRK